MEDPTLYNKIEEYIFNSSKTVQNYSEDDKIEYRKICKLLYRMISTDGSVVNFLTHGVMLSHRLNRQILDLHLSFLNVCYRDDSTAGEFAKTEQKFISDFQKLVRYLVNYCILDDGNIYLLRNPTNGMWMMCDVYDIDMNIKTIMDLLHLYSESEYGSVITYNLDLNKGMKGFAVYLDCLECSNYFNGFEEKLKEIGLKREPKFTPEGIYGL